jgi:acyl-CoA reductase-like NAD-dependent aldehyde dehydrogenase
VGVADAEAAISAAQRAFEDEPWPQMSTAERKRILYRFAQMVEGAGDEIMETRNVGRPIPETRGFDVGRVAHNCVTSPTTPTWLRASRT